MKPWIGLFQTYLFAENKKNNLDILLFFKNLLEGISKIPVVEAQENENTEELAWNLILLFLMSHLLIHNLQLKVWRDKN